MINLMNMGNSASKALVLRYKVILQHDGVIWNLKQDGCSVAEGTGMSACLIEHRDDSQRASSAVGRQPR